MRPDNKISHESQGPEHVESKTGAKNNWCTRLLDLRPSVKVGDVQLEEAHEEYLWAASLKRWVGQGCQRSLFKLGTACFKSN